MESFRSCGKQTATDGKFLQLREINCNGWKAPVKCGSRGWHIAELTKYTFQTTSDIVEMTWEVVEMTWDVVETTSEVVETTSDIVEITSEVVETTW